MIIIFDTDLIGHHLEYIHHLWERIATNENDANQYTFVLPEKGWQQQSSLRHWSKRDNIALRLLSDAELRPLKYVPVQKRSLKECLLIRKIVKEIGNVDRIILPNLNVSLPWLPLFLPSNVKVDGILYNIPLYSNRTGLLQKKESLNFNILAKSSSFDRVYLLNAKKAVKHYNVLYSTDNFVELVDPVPSVNFEGINRSLRAEYDSDAIIFLHFGAMGRRKGTIELLKSIRQLNDSKKRVFIIAGRIYNDIREEFFALVDECRSLGKIIDVREGFLSFEELYDLCYNCDCIVAPYLDTSCSSGVIGYGAVFGKPIIGSNEGLLGELIREHGLGKTVAVETDLLTAEIESFEPYTISSKYSETNSIENFQQTIVPGTRQDK